MKKIIFFGALLSSFISSKGQFITTGIPSASTIYESAKVGIGHTASTTVSEKLHINSGNFRITGTSTTSPATYTPASITAGALLIGNNAGTNSWMQSYGINNTTYATLLLNPKGGKVGIGITTAPTATLEIGNASSATIKLSTTGTALPQGSGITFHTGAYISTSTYPAPGSGTLSIDNSTSAINIFGGSLAFRGPSSFLDKVYIGSSWPASGAHTDYKLSVDGKLVVKSCYVTSVGWADFVFDKNYNLQSLSEVENFIKENGHLPEIPSATEIEENGMNVSELLKLQMQKIEELTLHLIEMKKEIETLKK
ncbi:MAG: hypothetical protein H7329_02155 [Opitutaceae bacterium]|nr:hypothetical protein [Cytophagales bacterium]